MTKIGIFGGTFNPPHMGHLIVCQSILTQLGLQKILLIPSSVSPHKQDKRLAPAPLRLDMTKLAAQDNPNFEVSDIEISRGGVSYTVDTLKLIRNQYLGTSLYLIIGVDNWMEFKTWRQPSEILDMATLVIMNRPGFSKTTGERIIDKNIKFVDVPFIGISGTMIRLDIKSGRSIKYLVPKAVEQFIHDHALFND